MILSHGHPFQSVASLSHSNSVFVHFFSSNKMENQPFNLLDVLAQLSTWKLQISENKYGRSSGSLMATQASSQDQGVQMMGRRRPQRTAGDSFGNHGAVHNVLLCLPCIADFLVLSACSNSKLPAHTSSCWPREQGLILNWLLGDTGEARNTDWHGKFLLFAANCTLRPQPLSCHPCIFIFA